MDNPENLEILKILVQTDAVRFRVPFWIRPPFSPHNAHVCHCCTCARPAHLNISTGRYNEFLSKTPHNDFSKQPAHTLASRFQKNAVLCIPDSKYPIITHLRSTYFLFFSYFAPFSPQNCVMYCERYCFRIHLKHFEHLKWKLFQTENRDIARPLS